MAISFCDEEEKAILRDVEMVIDKLLDIDYDNPFPLGSYVPDPNKPAPVRQGGRGRSGARRQEKPREQKGERPKTAASAAGGGPEAGHTARKRRRRPRRKPGASPERQA